MFLQLDSWKILYVLWVFTLVKELVLMTLLQHRLLLVLHGEQYFAVLLLAFFLKTLLLMIVLQPINSLRFLHLRNAMIGGSEKSFFSFGLIFRISHLSLKILPIFFRYIYIYTYILISSFTICIKIEICTQKKHMLVNVSAKAFISITFPNKMEHTYRL